MKRTDQLLKKSLFLILTIFFVALGIRFLIRQDSLIEAGKVQASVVESYRNLARIIVSDGVFSLFDKSARAASPDYLSHPPGYPLLLSFLSSVFGESNAVIQTVSIFFDALSSVLIFLIARRLFDQKVGAIAGLLASFCPQFAFNSILFLPDTLAIFPLLLALYCFIRAVQQPSLIWIIACGICLGASSWLRANSLLLPLFFAAVIFLIFEKKQKVYFFVALLAAFILSIAPVTIRNALVSHSFIPISIGAGQTLLEGIGDYDRDSRFGISDSDYGIMQMEAAKYNRPDYAVSLFGADGVQRDRQRLSQGFEFIRENPFWFGKTMFLRAISMTRLERVSIVSTEIPITNSLNEKLPSSIIWEKKGIEIRRNGKSVSNELILTENGDSMWLLTDNSKNGIQFSTENIAIKKNTDYLAESIVKMKKGRISIKVIGAESGRICGFSIVDFEEWENQKDASAKTIQIPFAAVPGENITFGVFNELPKTPGSIVEIEQMKIYKLGESSFIWTKPLRFIIKFIQKLFVTAVMLPLVIFGCAVLIWKEKRKELLVLLMIPAYYFCFQSILHTEYRYVLAIHYCFFVFAAYFMVDFGGWLIGEIKPFIERIPQNNLS